jgi:hypothetical protein
MGSNATDNKKTETNNVAIDHSATVGEGTQILDSIVVSSDALVVTETIKQHKAAFDVLTSNSTVQLESLLYLGEDILKMAKDGQVSMAQQQYHMLESGVKMLQDQREQGKYVIDFVDGATTKVFDLAETVNKSNSDVTARALDIVADVKTGDYSDTLQSVVTLMAAFALGAMYLMSKDN